MLEAIQLKRSWLTQRLANRFPPWSRVRRRAQSVGQMVLGPVAQELEDLYWWENYSLGNYLLNTSDSDPIGDHYKLSLPPTFDWRTREDADAVVYLAPTSVRGRLSGGTWVTLSQATRNSLEEFWFGAPDRITSSGETFTYQPVLSTTQISNLSTATLAAPAVPGKLFVTLSNNGSSMKNYRGIVNRSSILLQGVDIHGKTAKERIYFAFNGTRATKLAWSQIDSVSTDYVDDVAFLKVDWLTVGQADYMDPMGLHISKTREKFRFLSLGTQTFGSTLKQSTFAAIDLITVQEGDDSKEAVYEMELLDSAGSNISATSMCLWPHRKWVVVSSPTKLHFYIPEVELPDRSLLAERDTEVVLQIEPDREWSFNGDTVTFNYLMTRPFIRVLRTRWSVLKPSGSRVGLDPTGSEIAYSASGWVTNPLGTNFNRTGYGGTPFEYTLNETGTYVFYLESMIADSLNKSTENVVEQTDVMVIQSTSATAESSITLPVATGTTSFVGFDSWARPWVVSSTGVATRLSFHYDKYLADFNNKSIMVREDYDYVEVKA